ncbi:MAG: MFS transporter [Nocardioidaceae bacterium]|nr:MFS transporter [Nocardioidaceae bacterium]NUS51563.1 MFS transporter [Nocardioidaceae bacterium]
MGNMTEWFDYGVYAYAATYIAGAFFPSGDDAAATLNTLLVFAVSFLLRPVGGLVLGPIGDRFGRRRVLATTIVLMAASTFCVGLVPSYDQIGILAPILLVVLRVVQGFSTGGEYGGAATFMAEYAPDRRRGFFGSFLEFGTLAGFTLAALIVLIFELVLSPDAMASWGWRIPFLLGGPLGLVGLYLRNQLEDTPVFRDLEENDQVEDNATSALKDLVSTYWKQLLTLGGLVIALNVCNYTLLAYMPTYLEQKIGLSARESLVLLIIGQTVMMLLIPFSGRLSDRFGRKPAWWTSLIGLFIVAIPAFQLMGKGFALALVGFAVMGVLYVLQLSTISATFPAMFPTHVRFAGFAISYNVFTALFGGTAPAVNEKLIAITGTSIAPAYAMMVACLVGMVALVFVPETARASIRGTGLPGIDTEQKDLAPKQA